MWDAPGCSKPQLFCSRGANGEISVSKYVRDYSRASFCLNCSLERVDELRLLLEKLRQKGEDGDQKGKQKPNQ